ncbi:MAG TPA: TAT-variant-translocated molybdopterin oxidoreductase [Bryobacteraceae bacterium]|nr:TAT-variant-translocated molybdopterin oxidoreductase [Bryobacteraceae bacterium]
MSELRKKLDLAAARERLEATRGKEYWRSLDELASTPEFQDLLEREFPRQAVGWAPDENAGEGRRNFLKLMGASLALGGLAACTRQPTELITPYIQQPEDLIPGRPLFYATQTTLSGVSTGILAESHEGRPTKIEGNPEHPGSLGACDPFSQASVLQLYDPDRARALTFNGEVATWAGFYSNLRGLLADQQTRQGAGIRILTETINSPSTADLLNTIKTQFPQSKWHQWEPAGAHSARAASTQAFGSAVATHYNFLNANVVMSLDSDFLGSGPGWLRYAREFSAKRRVVGDQKAMNRLYVAEANPTATGSKADHRFPMRASDVEAFAFALASELGVGGAGGGSNPEFSRWATAVARDLQTNKGASIIIAGEQQPPSVHALAHAINAALGNVGKTVFYTDPVESNPVDQLASFNELLSDLDSGSIELLLIIGGNPVFNAPVEWNIAQRLRKAKLRMHLSMFEDETSEVCQWRLPETHALESWGDGRAYDGTVTLQQPLIEPLYGGRAANEILAMFTDVPLRGSMDIVKGYWAGQHKGTDFESFWRRSVHDGVLANSALPVKTVSAKGGAQPSPAVDSGKFEVIFRPDPAIYDGRFANNGWLQEFPRPVTKYTWDNAAIISPVSAKKLDIDTGDMVKLSYGGRSLNAPVWVQPGHADNCVTLHLGYGRTKAGHTGTGVGFNPYGLRQSKALWHDGGLDIQKISGSYILAALQVQHQLDTRRGVIQGGTLAEYIKNPDSIHEGFENPPHNLTLYGDWDYSKGYAWGMTIDVNACTGCGACIVACQAENNIAVVGKDQVYRGRLMQWLRVDSYYTGSVENPHIDNQPVPCQQCEDAPCELVCPVQATSHSAEGLNDMVYNRCVGTRYCSNNCPYKVRRFNFYLYSDYETPSLKLLNNPDVSVRSRGVMEKCTYCVQRINHAKIDAEKQNRGVRDGEIQTACQATCPTEAIIFGNINDPKSRVSQLKADKRNYSLLADLNTRPRTTYLGPLRNPNPELEA